MFCTIVKAKVKQQLIESWLVYVASKPANKVGIHRAYLVCASNSSLSKVSMMDSRAKVSEYDSSTSFYALVLCTDTCTECVGGGFNLFPLEIKIQLSLHHEKSLICLNAS